MAATVAAMQQPPASRGHMEVNFNHVPDFPGLRGLPGIHNRQFYQINIFTMNLWPGDEN
jgi:hypothetical protein